MMEQKDVEFAVDVLNQLYACDPEALSKLVSERVSCNKLLADHPTCQVGAVNTEKKTIYQVGMVGILNGIFGANGDGNGFIAAMFDSDTGKLTGFKSLHRGEVQ